MSRTALTAKTRLHGIIGFDRHMLDDKRQPPDSLSGAFGALSAAYLRKRQLIEEYMRRKNEYRSGLN